MDKEPVGRLREALGWFEGFVKSTGYIAGTDSMTVADLAALGAYTQLESTGNFFVDLKSWPHVVLWAERIKAEAPDYEEACGKGAALFKNFWDKFLKRSPEVAKQAHGGSYSGLRKKIYEPSPQRLAFHHKDLNGKLRFFLF